MPRIIPFNFEENPVESGQYATAQCTISHGDLPIGINWLFNDKNVDKANVLITAVGRRSSSLSIESVTYEHAGNYTCVGNNKVGSTQFTTQLHVNGIVAFSIIVIC